MDYSLFNKKYIIAELGMTHDGSFGQAKAMIKSAAECGVDAVKFQTHISAAETIRNAPTPPYFNEEPRYDYFNRTAFSYDQWLILKDYAHDIGVDFISSPFSIEAADLLAEVGVDAIKIPSGEITNIPLVEHLSDIDIPIIVSSGMTSLQELDECICCLLKNNSNLAIMQCSSEYPCTPEHVGLNVIDEYRDRYKGIPIGFSDHTSGIWASIAAFSKGATIVEKHFTLSKMMYGPDALMSMEPDEMRQLCESLDLLRRAMDNPIDKSDISEYINMRGVFTKSIVARHALKKGDVIRIDKLAFKKPGYGLETKYYRELIGHKINRDIGEDEYIFLEDII